MNTKNILWVNPSFLDYRIPLYKELNVLLNNKFHLIYSEARIPKRCNKKIKNSLAANAHPIVKESRISAGAKEQEFANTSVSIPIPRGLYKMISSVKPDLIIAEGFFQFTPWAAWYSWIHRIPLLVAYERTVHTERHCPWWRQAYRKFMNLFVSGYIANGQLTKEYLISQGVKPDVIFTGGMCADSENLSKSVSSMGIDERICFKRHIGIPTDSGLVYLYVGQLIERKGVRYLLNVWKDHIKQYKKDILLIAGGGDLLERFKTDFVDIRSIVFTGPIDYSLIYKCYAISDVFIIPTLEDNWSLVVPEAMACGLPIACSIYNGCYPELVIKDYNGCTFDPLDASSIKETLSYFHDVDLERFGNNSKKIESNYSPWNTAKNIIKAIDAYCGNYMVKK